MTRNDEVPQEVGDALIAHDAAAAAVPGSRRHAEWRAIRDYITTLRAKLKAAEGEVARLRGLGVWRDAVMDGNAVYGALTDYAKRRTGPENVSDTLDAVAVVARAAALGGNANA